jgi:hypothetical protein
MKEAKPKINCRTKGMGFERTISKIMSTYTGLELRRTPLSGGWAGSDRSGFKGDIQDITGSGDFCFSIECKKVEGWTFNDLFNEKNIIMKWWDQCSKQCPKGKIPLLVFSKNRERPFAMLAAPSLNERLGGKVHQLLSLGGITWTLGEAAWFILPLNLLLENVSYAELTERKGGDD